MISNHVYDESVQSVRLECEKAKLKTISNLSELAKFRSPGKAPVFDADRDKIRSLVEQLKNREDPVAFAKIATALRQHSSTELECKDSRLISVFEVAFWHSLELLAKNRSE